MTAPFGPPPISAKNLGRSLAGYRPDSGRSMWPWSLAPLHATHIGVAPWLETGGVLGSSHADGNDVARAAA